MDIQLTGKRALVGGASRGIGRAIATELAAQGASVIALARNDEALAALIAELPASDGQAHRYLAVDVADGEALSTGVAALVESSPIPILVNNSGGPPAGEAHEADPGQFEAAFRQHLLANQRLVQTLLPGMKAAGYGRVINIISTSVKEPIPGLGVSNTIRGAVASWAKTLARELGSFGITVNNVLPGFTATERLDYFMQMRAEAAGADVEEIRQEAAARVPAGRFAEPAEIAAAVAFLASPAAAYINGINLPVDGGMTGSL